MSYPKFKNRWVRGDGLTIRHVVQGGPPTDHGTGELEDMKARITQIEEVLSVLAERADEATQVAIAALYGLDRCDE